MNRILIAGIGNIFCGDDAFGCEVARALLRVPLPPEAQVFDFGIRSYDLAYALTEENEAVILIDATPRGELPGATCLLEIDPAALSNFGVLPPDGHSLNPVSVLQMAQNLGGVNGKIYLVGCEPAVLDSEEGEIGLSEPVRQAIPQAVEMIATLCREISGAKEKTTAGLAPA
ncbi:MAG TPA: hydrogenase maturation protease [Verrucomicrobiae bacterium]|jgi:hydrogenase maturation protease|nr:hydrogenase maturation protease [Verrucomicrobiae bacterium]